MPPCEWAMAKAQFAMLFGELQAGNGWMNVNQPTLTRNP
jgi:hypothetical protein